MAASEVKVLFSQIQIRALKLKARDFELVGKSCCQKAQSHVCYMSSDTMNAHVCNLGKSEPICEYMNVTKCEKIPYEWKSIY